MIFFLMTSASQPQQQGFFLGTIGTLGTLGTISTIGVETTSYLLFLDSLEFFLTLSSQFLLTPIPCL